MINDDPTKIEPVLKELQKNFLDQQTKQIRFRKQQLQNLLRGLKELRPEIHQAQEKDLGIKNPNLGETFYLVPIEKALEHVISHFEVWTRPRFVKTPLLVGSGSSKIVPEPFGTVLVIGSWNYPFFTALAPAFEAIAAGNCVALKPSELAPNISKVLRKLFEKYLDTRYYQVIEGGVEVAKKISTYKWDLIIFTGSPEKGRLVAKAAADNLVPVILELGGKSPCIIDQDANIENAAIRICSGKYQNCGQTCIAPDFILVHESQKDKFIKSLQEKIELFYSQDPQNNQDYSRIISEFHAERQVKMIEEVKDKIVYGGNSDSKDRYVQPTIVLNPGKESQIMKEEIFGPILPVITYKDFVGEVLNPIMRDEKPLALYYFGGNKEHIRVLEQQTSSGAFVHNDVIMHSVVNDLPFGGVGKSGQSRLHGLYGFEACSHMKPILYKDTSNSFPNHIRFPPYTDSKMKFAKFVVPFGHITNEDVKSGILLAVFIVLFYFVVIPQIQNIFGNDSQQNADL